MARKKTALVVNLKTITPYSGIPEEYEPEDDFSIYLDCEDSEGRKVYVGLNPAQLKSHYAALRNVMMQDWYAERSDRYWAQTHRIG